jgi:hypothetical protein
MKDIRNHGSTIKLRRLLAGALLLAALPARAQMPPASRMANLNDAVVFANAFQGADAGARIQAAHDALPSVGGTIDARGLTGVQTVGGLTLSKSVRLLLGAATYNLTGTINVTAPAVSIAGLGRATVLDVVFTPPVAAIASQSVTFLILEDFVLQRSGTFSGSLPRLIYGNNTNQFRFRRLSLSGGDEAEILLDDFWNGEVRDCVMDGNAGLTAVGIKALGSSVASTTFYAYGNEFNGYDSAILSENTFGIRVLGNIFLRNNRAMKMTGGAGGTFAENWVESGGVSGTFAVEVDRFDVTRFSYHGNWLSGAPTPGAIVSTAGETLSPDDEFVLRGELALAPAAWLGGFKLQALGISGGIAPAFSAPSDFTITGQSATTDFAARGGDIVLTGGEGSLGQSRGIVIANNLYAEEARNGDVVLTGINTSPTGNGGWIETAASDPAHYALAVTTGAAPAALYVRADGRVGMGNGSPTQRLDINGSATAALNTVSFSATPTFDATLGNTQKMTLGGNVTSSTLSNASAGQWLYFIICQDATGGRTFVWPSNVKGGMTIGSAASTCSAQAFIFDGSNAYATSAGVTNQ